jgi:rhodanese-related sulfurtransferase
MPSISGAVAGLILIGIIAYYFWRGTAVVMKARHLVDDEGAFFIDASTRAEFLAAHIAGAVNIPAAEVALRQGEIGPVDHPIVIYARSGFDSARAAHVLRSIGYHSVTNVGPMTRWGSPSSGRWEGDPPPEIIGRAPNRHSVTPINGAR